MTNREFIQYLETLDLDGLIVYPYEDVSVFTFNPVSKDSIKEIKVKVKDKELVYICLDVENDMDIE